MERGAVRAVRQAAAVLSERVHQKGAQYVERCGRGPDQGSLQGGIAEGRGGGANSPSGVSIEYRAYLETLRFLFLPRGRCRFYRYGLLEDNQQTIATGPAQIGDRSTGCEPACSSVDVAGIMSLYPSMLALTCWSDRIRYNLYS